MQLATLNPRYERSGLAFAFRCSSGEIDVALPDGRECVIARDYLNDWWTVSGPNIFAEGFSSDDDAEDWLTNPERSWNGGRHA